MCALYFCQKVDNDEMLIYIFANACFNIIAVRACMLSLYYTVDLTLVSAPASLLKNAVYRGAGLYIISHHLGKKLRTLLHRNHMLRTSARDQMSLFIRVTQTVSHFPYIHSVFFLFYFSLSSRLFSSAQSFFCLALTRLFLFAVFCLLTCNFYPIDQGRSPFITTGSFRFSCLHVRM